MNIKINNKKVNYSKGIFNVILNGKKISSESLEYITYKITEYNINKRK